MKRIFKTIVLAGTLLGLGIAQAQQVTELAKHPGDVLKFSLTFSGPDADKVQKVVASIARTGPNPQPANQSGFPTGADSGWVTNQTSTRTSVVEIKIPTNIMSGSYRLQIDTSATIGGAEYLAGKDFPLPEIHIENPNTFTPPKIEVKELH